MQIQLNNLSKSYGKKHVLNNITFTFFGPGLYIIFGPSGCGKTTLLNVLGRLESVEKQQIIYKLQGSKIPRCGMIFQHNYLIGDLTCMENVLLPRMIKNQNFDKKNTMSLFKEFGLEHLIHRKVSLCSGGECQRVNLIRTIVSEPNHILADEPTGSIDQTSARIIRDSLVNLSKHLLVIIVTHDIKLFSDLPAHYLSLKGGQISVF